MPETNHESGAPKSSSPEKDYLKETETTVERDQAAVDAQSAPQDAVERRQETPEERFGTIHTHLEAARGFYQRRDHIASSDFFKVPDVKDDAQRAALDCTIQASKHLDLSDKAVQNDPKLAVAGARKAFDAAGRFDHLGKLKTLRDLHYVERIANNADVDAGRKTENDRMTSTAEDALTAAVGRVEKGENAHDVLDTVTHDRGAVEAYWNQVNPSETGQ